VSHLASEADERPVVLEVTDLRTFVFMRRGVVRAVDGVSFAVRQGETLGIVGESGCGKSMTALSLVRLVPPAARIVGGQVRLAGENLLELSEAEMRRLRGRRISMILQDPHSSLNPVLTIGDQIREALRRRLGGGRRVLAAAAIESLRRVGIPNADARTHGYPHQMSGGMKQRVVGAIAMAGGPLVIIADEPTTALDVTIQAQYLRLLRDLQDDTGVALVFITHDFGIVAKMCDRVAVMYAGRVVEQAPVRVLFDEPAHPYTEALLASVPRIDGRPARLPSIEGQPPELHALPPGCRFAPRCQYAGARCHVEAPPTFVVGPTHTAECWRLDPSWASP